jgi:hypothetical protein
MGGGSAEPSAGVYRRAHRFQSTHRPRGRAGSPSPPPFPHRPALPPTRSAHRLRPPAPSGTAGNHCAESDKKWAAAARSPLPAFIAGLIVSKAPTALGVGRDLRARRRFLTDLLSLPHIPPADAGLLPLQERQGIAAPSPTRNGRRRRGALCMCFSTCAQDRIQPLPPRDQLDPHSPDPGGITSR